MILNFGIFGIIAFVFYLMAVILGGIWIPGYNHFNRAISEMDAVIGRQYKLYLELLFTLYNLAVSFLGLGILLPEENRKDTPAFIIGIGLLCAGVFGILMFLFPMDIVGAKMTVRGIVHMVLAGLLAPISILTTVMGFLAYNDSKTMRVYSLATGVVITLSGIMTVVYAAHGMKAGFGLLERTTIGAFIFWLLFNGIYFLRKPGVRATDNHGMSKKGNDPRRHAK
jgi:hypothetical protein